MATTPEDTILYSMSEASTRTGISEAGLRARVNRGLIPVVRTATGRIRITSEVVEQLRTEQGERLTYQRRELEMRSAMAGFPG